MKSTFCCERKHLLFHSAVGACSDTWGQKWVLLLSLVKVCIQCFWEEVNLSLFFVFFCNVYFLTGDSNTCSLGCLPRKKWYREHRIINVLHLINNSESRARVSTASACLRRPVCCVENMRLCMQPSLESFVLIYKRKLNQTPNRCPILFQPQFFCQDFPGQCTTRLKYSSCFYTNIFLDITQVSYKSMKAQTDASSQEIERYHTTVYVQTAQRQQNSKK